MDIKKQHQNRESKNPLKNKLKKIGSIYRAVKSKLESFRKKENNKVINISPKPKKQVTHARPSRER